MRIYCKLKIDYKVKKERLNFGRPFRIIHSTMARSTPS